MIDALFALLRPFRLSHGPARGARAPYLFILPALLIIGIFHLAPVVFALLVSFVRWDAIDGLSSMRFAGFDNYLWVFVSDDWFGGALIQSLWLLVVGGALVQLCAIPLAFFLHHYLQRRLRWVLGAFFLPYLISGTTFGFLFWWMFMPDGGGLFNAILLGLRELKIFGVSPIGWLLPTEPVEWFRYGDALSALAVAFRFVGWNTMWYVAALATMPAEQSEAARLDGARPWQELLYLTVPWLKPTIFFATTITSVACMVDHGSVGGYMHWLSFFIGDFGAACAIGVIVLILQLLLVWLLWRYACGQPDLVRMASDPRAPGLMRKAFHRCRGALGQAAIRWLAAPPAPTGQLKGFDGMRALACLMVIYHHLCQRVDASLALPWVFHPFIALGLKTDMGVSLFFVLSGALLSTPFWQRFLDGAPPPALGQYCLRRAARILPGYWLALGACVAIGLTAMPEAQFVTERALAGAFFVSALHYVSFFPSELDPTLWSISLEVICYVLLPLLILPAWRLIRDRDPARLLRYMIWLLLGLQLAHFVIVGAFMTDKFEKGWSYGMIGGAKEWLPYWSPATFMTQFMLGSAASLAIAWRRRQPRPAIPEEHDRMAGWALFAAFMVCAFLGQMGTPNFVTRQPYVTPIFPALCAFALYAMQFGERIAAILDNRLFRFIATISFGLYLWHWPIMELIRIYYEPTFKVFSLTSGVQWLGLCATVIVSATAIASLSWYVLERPVLRWAHRMDPSAASRRSAKAQPAR